MSLMSTFQAVQASAPTFGQFLAHLWAWLYLHWLVVLAVVAYVVANVAPRPHPEALVGWRKIFWTVIDRTCVLTAAALPGVLKAPGTASPPLVVPAGKDDTRQ
jgi:hypothetical protein